MAYEVFISYSHQDQTLRQKLENHQANRKRQNIITSWYDDFMASAFCYSIEMTSAIDRHDANQARVIPIILRPVDWTGAPFEKIQALPTSGKPVTDWPNQDNAFVDIVRGIRKAINDLTIKNIPAKTPRHMIFDAHGQKQLRKKS